MKQHWLSSEELHAQQSKHNYEEEEQEQQADDRLHRVEKGHDEVAQRRPVPDENRGVRSAWCMFYKYKLECREVKQLTHLVTLKILNNLRARNTLMPNDVPGWMMDHRTSNILPHIT